MSKSVSLIVTELRHLATELENRAPAMAADNWKNKAVYLEQENQRLKAELSNTRKSRDTYKGMYEKWHKTAMQRKTTADKAESENILLKTELRTFKNIKDGI